MDYTPLEKHYSANALKSSEESLKYCIERDCSINQEIEQATVNPPATAKLVKSLKEEIFNLEKELLNLYRKLYGRQL